MNFLHLKNYQDKTYRHVVFSCILIMILSGDILSPLLNYMALDMPKSNSNFTNYATLASIVPGLPFLLSVGISFTINNCAYRFLALSCCLISGFLGLLIWIFADHNFLILSIFIFIICCLMRALYFSLDRQISSILITKIKDFQSDLFILSGIFGALSYKFSAYLYVHFHMDGISGVFLIGCGLLFWSSSQIPVANSQQLYPELKLANLRNLCQIMGKAKDLVKYIGLISGYIFCGGAINILIMTKTHQEQSGLTYFSELMSYALIINVLSAGCCKFASLRRRKNLHLIACSIGLTGLILLCMLLWPGKPGFTICYLGYIGVTSFTLINVNSQLFKRISIDPGLVAIAPFLNGMVATIYYAMGLISQLSVNLALNFHLNYQLLLLFMAVGNVVLAISLFRTKSSMFPAA